METPFHLPCTCACVSEVYDDTAGTYVEIDKDRMHADNSNHSTNPTRYQECENLLLQAVSKQCKTSTSSPGHVEAIDAPISSHVTGAPKQQRTGEMPRRESMQSGLVGAEVEAFL